MSRTGRKRCCMPLRIKWWKYKEWGFEQENRSHVRVCMRDRDKVFLIEADWTRESENMRARLREERSFEQENRSLVRVRMRGRGAFLLLNLSCVPSDSRRDSCSNPLLLRRALPWLSWLLFNLWSSLTLLCICIYNYSINFIRRAGPKRGTQRLKGARRRVLALGMKRSLRFCGCSLMGKKEG